MNTSEILGRDDIYFDLPLERKREVIQFLAERVGEKTPAGVNACRSALAARERLGSTGLGSGIAIPHAQLEGLERAKAIFVRLATPIEFGAADGEPVDIVLMLLTPLGASADHLETLSRLAKTLRFAATKQRLRSAQSPDEILDALGA